MSLYIRPSSADATTKKLVVVTLALVGLMIHSLWSEWWTLSVLVKILGVGFLSLILVAIVVAAIETYVRPQKPDVSRQSMTESP